jgi:hypothetical protein
MRMRKVVLVASMLLACCAYFQDPREAEANIVAPSNFRAGSGVIQSVAVMPNANAANPRPIANRKSPDPNLYRLALLMDADGFQTVDVDNGNFYAGEAVELTNDGRVLRVSGTSLNRALER